MKRVAINTLGCKLNFAESSTVGRQFISQGFVVVQFNEVADVYLINTCSLSHRAERECRQIIRSAIKRAPDAYIIVFGCYSQLQPEQIASISGVDLVLGTKEKFDVFKYADNFQKKNYPRIFTSDVLETNDFGIAYSGDVDTRTRAFLKVQDGCDYKCSYCTIPLARGASRSQTVEDSVLQMRLLAEKGFKEVIISGINVGDYGKSTDENLYSLLNGFSKVDGIERIRISSIEPNLLDEKLLDFILTSEKFCNHFHIPLQSGSDEILKLMRRRYTRENYQNVVANIFSRNNEAGIGADVIVGFPGETDKHFDESYDFIRDLPLSYLHVFTYSERPNTPASTFTNPVEPRIRFLRNEKLRILSQKKKYHFNSRFENKIVKILFEGKIKDDTVTGLTGNYIRVKSKAGENVVNEILNTKITRVLEDECEGKILNNKSDKIK